MGGAAFHVVACRRNRTDRAGRETWPIPAIVAGMREVSSLRERNLSFEKESGAVRVPEPEFRVDQDAERRGLQRLCPLGPTLEWVPGRSAERKQSLGPKMNRNGLDHPLGPAVQSRLG